MKRIFCFCLAFLICFCLFGCEDSKDSEIDLPNEKENCNDSETDLPNEKENCNDSETELPAPEKPILYFYNDSQIKCSVRVILDGELTCTYPEHGADGWNEFTVCPDGTLIFPDDNEYYALYWEGVQNTKWDFSEGFCVRGEDTAAFLEWALAEQGLTAREANEFIIYWLPRMQENPYNVISFQTTAYTDGAVLDIAPAPDSLLRVFMAYYPSDVEVDIQPQEFCGFVREGFTVVEWGGDQAKKP